MFSFTKREVIVLLLGNKGCLAVTQNSLSGKDQEGFSYTRLQVRLMGTTDNPSSMKEAGSDP